MPSMLVMCSLTKAVLLGYAAGPFAAASHSGAVMAVGTSSTLKRWCRMRACSLKPGLWNESARDAAQRGGAGGLRRLRGCEEGGWLREGEGEGEEAEKVSTVAHR